MVRGHMPGGLIVSFWSWYWMMIAHPNMVTTQFWGVLHLESAIGMRISRLHVNSLYYDPRYSSVTCWTETSVVAWKNLTSGLDDISVHLCFAIHVIWLFYESNNQWIFCVATCTGTLFSLNKKQNDWLTDWLIMLYLEILHWPCTSWLSAFDLFAAAAS